MPVVTNPLPMRSEPISDPMTWVFSGDSITQAVWHTHGARGWVEHLAEHIHFGLGRLLDPVINSGVSGWTAPEVLQRYDHLIGRYRPDVVSVALGTNDAHRTRGYSLDAFTDALTQLVQRARSDGALVVLHTPVTMADAARELRPDLPAYADAVRAVADRSDSRLVDHHRAWTDGWVDPTGVRREPLAWLDDTIHPGPVGHEAMAQLTVGALGLGTIRDQQQRWPVTFV